MARFYITFILIFVLPYILHPQSQDIKFERISVEQGLSNDVVHCIFQDSKGFMWFGTQDGLNKFDGYKFTIYKYDPANPSSLSNNDVKDIYEDQSTNLWIATAGGGLNKFDRETEKFTYYKFDRNNLASISSNDINQITRYRYADQEVLWIGTANGLNKFDLETEQFTYYPHTNKGYPYNFVEAMVVDSLGKVWIGCASGGLHRFDPETEKYIHYLHDTNNPNTVSSNLMWSLLVDRSGILWIGTDGGGLNKFDKKTKQFTHYRYDPNNPKSLSDNGITSIYEDKAGILWIGTWEGGLNKFDKKTQQFTQYKHDPDKPHSLSINSIWSIYQDKSDVLWIGTYFGGLNRFNPGKMQFEHPHYSSYYSENLYLPVWGINESESGVLWVGTWGKGLVKIDRKQGMVSSFLYDPNNPNSLSNNIVSQIINSHHSGRNVLWIGTYNGLNKLDLKTEQITRYFYNPDSIMNIIRSVYEDKTGTLWVATQVAGLNKFDRETGQFTLVGKRMQVMQVYEDKSGVFWVATFQGLKKLDRETEQFTTFLHDPDNPNSISNNQIISINETNFQGKDMLWVGTSGGLNKFDPESEKFTSYSTDDGLPNDVINGILEDKHGNLWLSTNNGLSKFNPETEDFRNYNVVDGLKSNQFIQGTYFQSRDGAMFFGGTKGFDAFYPDNIKDNTRIPPVIITDFQIFNKPVKIKRENSAGSENDYFLSKSINTIEEIELSYRENIFSFEFAALDYRSSQKNQYAYLMEGVDPDWVYADASRRFATYTNLDPGKYVFRVKGSNNDGLWNEEGTSIKIIITPPWWKTNWAYSLYLLFIGFIIFSIWRFQTSRLKMRQLMEMNHFEAEKLREVDHMKSRFFANISHEFRTPLTLIKGPVKQMLTGEFIGNVKDQYKMILRNSDRLLSLINQILDLSKLDLGRMTLKVTCTEIYQLLNGLFQSFSSLAERKNISFKFNAADESIVGYVDRDKLEKIITNLLSNAFKFTAEGGEVLVNVKKHLPESPLDMGKGQLVKGDKGGCLQITISNTGAGIPPDQLGKIFDRFYQTNNYYTKDSEGSGIGLALTKELVEAHHGKIRVESKLQKETTFTVLLPINKEDFNPEEIVKEAEAEDWKPEAIKQILLASTPDTDTRYQIPDTEEQYRVSNRSPVSGRQSPLVLIVEDNPDVTSYISSFLDKDYHIITAENGKTGLVTARDKFPDLIITDVMMPEMDGFELCSKLKSDTRTSHIPVILLTARADTESKIEGLEFGADDYISKPFEADELKTRVKNLIDLRRKLRERFQKELKIHPAEITAGSMDEKFLENICTIVEQHMDDENLTAEKLAVESNMSHRNLNRKLKALTGHSAQEFISIMRLKRAAQLLQTNSDTVTQIAYQVGFSSMSYFAKVFRHQFSTTPSQYRNHFQKSS